MVKKPTLILKVDTTPTATEIASPLADLKVNDTRLIKFEDPKGQPMSLRMGKDFNTWSIDQNMDVPVDAGKVMQVLTELQSLKPVGKLESTLDENAMGIGAGSKKVTLVDESGSTTEIVFGDKTATGSGDYIKVGNALYIVNTNSMESITGLLTMDSMIKKTEMPTAPISETPQP
jgi:hypothetical protein